MGILPWLANWLRRSPIKRGQLDGISEPILSLIESLGRDEWELLEDAPLYKEHFSGKSLYLVHCFHENLTLHLMCPAGRVHHYTLINFGGMTSSELDVLVPAIERRGLWLEEISLSERHKNTRNKFMILVKDNNVQD